MNIKQILLITCVLVAVSGCQQGENKTQQTEAMSESSATSVLTQQVQRAIAKAKTEQDFRFYSLAGRRITVPGVDVEQQKDLLKQCGVKPLPDYKDHFKTPEQREQNKQQRAFAKAYNLEILKLCQQ